MGQMEQLQEYCRNSAFRDALSLAPDADVVFTLLAQGEYHRNFVFVHPVSNKKYVLRVNYGSQMHLENQIKYEYDALFQLRNSGRTPAPVFMDDSKTILQQGVLVMEFIEGRPLSYKTDLSNAARCLADVHCTVIEDPEKLIEIPNPIMGILEECEEMFSVYKESKVSEEKTIQKVVHLMSLAYQKAELLTDKSYENVCINTELNNYNFLVNEKDGFVSLIDWEKPLFGDPAQDIGHMLAPTTTFWRTDVILEKQNIDAFTDAYIRAVDHRIDLGKLKERVSVFLPVTCLRGITWCAMAYVEYMEPGRAINNPGTFEKLKAYQSDEFLLQIENYLLNS